MFKVETRQATAVQYGGNDDKFSYENKKIDVKVRATRHPLPEKYRLASRHAANAPIESESISLRKGVLGRSSTHTALHSMRLNADAEAFAEDHKQFISKIVQKFV